MQFGLESGAADQGLLQVPRLLAGHQRGQPGPVECRWAEGNPQPWVPQNDAEMRQWAMRLAGIMLDQKGWCGVLC